MCFSVSLRCLLCKKKREKVLSSCDLFLSLHRLSKTANYQQTVWYENRPTKQSIRQGSAKEENL